jgi:hypothetical protein
MSTENESVNLEVNRETIEQDTVSVTKSEDTNAEVDPLDELKDIDFLLEDIEDKIAPLALLPSS